MTMTLHWWLIPIVLVALGIAGAWKYGRPKGDYGMVSGLIGGGCFILGVSTAVGFVVGRLFG